MNVEMPLVSIIVPVYNVENYLGECIDSISGQSYHNIEIILVDDGSSDGSGMICDSYAERDSRIKVIHQDNAGPSSARNAGLSIMNGHYVMMVDGDDFIYKDCVERLVRYIVETEADLVIGGHIKVHATDHITDIEGLPPKSKSEQLLLDSTQLKKEMLSGRLNMYVHGKLYSADIINRVEFVENRLFEDVLFLWDILKFVNKSVVISDVLYCYRQRPNSIINSAYSHARMDQVYAAEHIYIEIGREDGVLRRIASSRIFFCAMDNYSMINAEDGEDCSYLIHLIRLHRWNVCRDAHSSLMLKLIALSACISVTATGRLVRVYKRLKASLFLK